MRSSRPHAHCPPATVDLLRECARVDLDPMDALRVAAGTISLRANEPAAIVALHPNDRRRVLATAARDGADRAAAGPGPRRELPLHAERQGAGPERVRGLETYLNTVVDHGLNASTFTARVITSTGSDLVSAVVGAIGALKGPLHGGAPGPALDMVFEIAEASRAEAILRGKIEAGEKLMGFGHRVYKVRDPRADVLATAAERMYTRAGDMSLYTLARAVEATAIRLLEEYKPGRRLQTNVEFYTALLLHGLGLDVVAVHADVCDQPRERMDRARPRAAAREPHHPSAVGVRRSARPPVGSGLATDRVEQRA